MFIEGLNKEFRDPNEDDEDAEAPEYDPSAERNDDVHELGFTVHTS